MQLDNAVASISAVFLKKKTGTTVVILGRKTLHWQLSKVISSVMYKGNFEAIN